MKRTCNHTSHHTSTSIIKMILAAIIFFCSAGPVYGAGPTETPGERISQIDIQIRGVKKGAWEAIARDLIQLNLTDVYRPGLLEQAIARLVESNLFQSIHVPDPEKTDPGVKIRFELVPFGRIKDIRVYNAFPVFDKEVVNVMTLFNGDAFSAESLSDQSNRVVTLFKKRGFIDPKVVLSAQKDAADGNYVLAVHIDKGDYLQVNQVDIRGNNHFSASRLKLRTRIWKSSLLLGSARRFVQKDLDGDVKNLIAFYREKGFADVRVTAQAKRDLKKKQMDVIFSVEEGPRYKIVFKGNENLWAYTLRKEMTLERDGNKNDFALRKSIRNLEQTYAQKGYPDVKISSKVSEPDMPQSLVKQVILDIHEGIQYRVSKIDITGNTAVSQKEIFNNILTCVPRLGNSGIYVSKILDDDLNAIRTLYLKEGFTRTRIDKHVRVRDAVDTTQRKQVEINLVIDEGIQTHVDTVRFDGLSVLGRTAALDLISLKPGAPFRDYMIGNDETSLKQRLSELGYPHNQVTATQKFSPDRSRVDLTYTINEGPHIKVGQIYYVGNFRTKKAVLDTEMEVAQGESLSLTKLLESRRNMMDMNALDSARFRTVGLKQKAPEVDIVVAIEEKKPYSFETGTGYDTERHFYLNSSVGDHNFGGKNLDLQLEAEVSQIGYKGNLSLLEPRFLSFRTGSSTKLFGEQQEEFNKDFGTRTYGVSQDFYHYFLSRRLTINLGLMYESREQYLTQNQEVTLAEIEDYDPRQIVRASPGIVFQTTDSFVRPTKGSLTSFNVDVSKGIDDTLDDYVKYRLDTRYYYTLFNPLVFALRGRYYFIQPYGGNSRVAEDQLFFLGGTSSVRGFGENLLEFDTDGQAVGGREVILGNIEARYDLGLNFELTAFYDIGSVRRLQGRSGSDAFRDAAGLGLRYMTPIGPIGFLYGWKLAPRANESAGSFHFSMGYTF